MILPVRPGTIHFVGHVVVSHLSDRKSLTLVGDGALGGDGRRRLDFVLSMICASESQCGAIL
jgi:hypothetical protein